MATAGGPRDSGSEGRVSCCLAAGVVAVVVVVVEAPLCATAAAAAAAADCFGNRCAYGRELKFEPALIVDCRCRRALAKSSREALPLGWLRCRGREMRNSPVFKFMVEKELGRRRGLGVVGGGILFAQRNGMGKRKDANVGSEVGFSELFEGLKTN